MSAPCSEPCEVLWPFEGPRKKVEWRWIPATITGRRTNDLSVKPNHFRVYVPGPGRGTYQMPMGRVRRVPQ